MVEKNCVVEPYKENACNRFYVWFFYFITRTIMDKKIIIQKLKKQIQSLWLLQFKDSHDIKFSDWARTTKLYIVNLSLEKKDEHIRNEYIKMFDECVNNMPHYNNFDSEDKTKEEINYAKKELQNLLRSIIEILEIYEEEQKSHTNSTKIKIENTQFNVQKINIKQIIKNTLNEIEKGDKPEGEQKEAKEKLKQLEKELGKSWWKNWETIKWLIKRFADFWKDVFIALIPAILKYYWYWE